jgi:O-antigen ligase
MTCSSPSYANSIPFKPPAAARIRPAESRWESISFFMVWVLGFSIPWGDMVSLPYDVQASRVLTIITAGFFSAALWRRHPMRQLDKPLWWMLLFVAWAAFSVLWSIEAEKSFRRVLSYFQLFLNVWLIHQAIRTTARYDKILLAYIAGCYVAMAGIAYNFSRSVTTGDGRFTAPGFDPNDLAVTLVLGIPLAWYLAFRRNRFVWFSALYVPCAIASSLLTASRGALITLVVCLLYPLMTIPKASIRALLVLVLLVAVSGGVLLSVQSEIAFDRLGTITQQFTARDLNGRFDIWERGLAVFYEHPLAGVGTGAFGSAAGARRSRDLVAHNILLGVLVDHGLIGIAMLIGIILSLFSRAWTRNSDERSLWLVVLLAWCVAVMSLSWENRELTWLLWGLCVCCPIVSRQHKKRIPLLWRPN